MGFGEDQALIVAHDEPGRYSIMVKVIDMFGDDTSQGIDVEVG
jgi:hypothetical protein